MPHIALKNLIHEKHPTFLSWFPDTIKEWVFALLEKFLHLKAINEFIEKNQNLKGIEFIDEVFEYFDFSYIVSKKDRDRIPSEGRVIIIANHPLGGLDGLALLKLVSEVRRDVKIVVNDLLLHINNLNDLFLPVDILNPGMQRENYDRITAALCREEAVIFFPAGEVSRLSINGITDSAWNKGILFFSKKCNADILPVFIKAHNSFLFYFVSAIYKKASMFLLPAELFGMSHTDIAMKIGAPVSPKTISKSIGKPKMQLKLLRKHLYHIGKDKPGVFKTEKSVIQPIDIKILKKQLLLGKYLGETFDRKQQFIVEFMQSPDVVREIARLREITFRKIGEGTGKKADTDIYDTLYTHLVHWDDKESEIVGAYRIGSCKDVIQKNGPDGLYTSTLFEFSKEFESLLPESIELGRSFIQTKYWNTNALDYLWQGLGAYIASEPSVRYLFGGVSLSGAFPIEAASMIVYFYKKWFSANTEMLRSKNRFEIPAYIEKQCAELFSGNDQKTEQKLLKDKLKQFNVAVPPLFKQYTGLCTEGGVSFLDFGTDPDFANCIDGLILVDIKMMKPEKRDRYIKMQVKEKAA
ncbi:MAG: GNAT family N-acetyltransferase [Ignavibacteriales bacterium]|nr:GNAT family N-acetyltransferase [Ignavibacteriales bacterium]